jgi:CxxC motif-containing protein (DUF1111 family)
MDTAVLRAWLCAGLLVLGACGSDKKDPLADLTVVHEDPSGVELSPLDAKWQDRFTHGDALFDRPFTDALGLGPVYIRPACASCHAEDARGPGAVRKMALVGDDGVTPLADQSGLPYGHTVRPQTAAGAKQGITAPADQKGLLMSTRMPPAVFGRGWLEAIADDEIERVEAEQADRGDVSGRINRVEYRSQPNPDSEFHSHKTGQKNLIGRFGLKARIASLDEFAADAYQGDMGITSPLRPDELPNPSSEDDAKPGVDIDADTVNRVGDYMRVLRIPTRAKDADDEDAKALFAGTGCADCHVPSLHTRADYPIEELADKDAHVFTDMLLHDMGKKFADGLQDYDAQTSEWRTAPLIGMHHLHQFLHDGRAETIEDAIVLHGDDGSEAKPAVDAFLKLSKDDREALLSFVEAL